MQAFRPTNFQVTAYAQAATVVLCNDKPATFGAPDVLQFRYWMALPEAVLLMVALPA